ncbi:MAG: hypothetical protein ACXWMV_07195 [Syntrophales bacterium]
MEIRPEENNGTFKSFHLLRPVSSKSLFCGSALKQGQFHSFNVTKEMVIINANNRLDKA